MGDTAFSREEAEESHILWVRNFSLEDFPPNTFCEGKNSLCLKMIKTQYSFKFTPEKKVKDFVGGKEKERKLEGPGGMKMRRKGFQ